MLWVTGYGELPDWKVDIFSGVRIVYKRRMKNSPYSAGGAVAA